GGPAGDRPTVARSLLDGPVLPRVTDTVRVAEAVRRAALARFGWWCQARHGSDAVAAFRRTDGSGAYASPVLAGTDAAGRSLPGHGHAYDLPTAEGADRRRQTPVTVFARDGFGPAEQAAPTGVRTVRVGERTVRAQLVGLG